jgi:ABC-type antimicrobial peptide transport system permease subunit
LGPHGRRIRLLLGFSLTLASGRFPGKQLYGIDPHNPLVAAIAFAALGLSGLFAALIPALRASRISPLDALRAE